MTGPGGGQTLAAAPDLDFRVLGRVEVWRGGGQAVSAGRGAAVNLLAGLLVSANTVVTADRLAEIAWGGRQPQHSRSALHTKMSRLRRLVGEEVIATGGGGYRLRVDPDRLDLLRFRDLVASAARLPDAGAAAALAEAIGLWRGTPLSDADSPVLQSEVVPGLVERYLAVCEQWAAVSLRLGLPGQVAERLAPVVAGHPFRESLAGQLMVAQHRSGRSADALAVYETLRRALREELGTDPGGALQDLQVTILRGTLSDAIGDGAAERPGRRLTRTRHRRPPLPVARPGPRVRHRPGR